MIRNATAVQKERIIELLNLAVFSRQEKKNMLLRIGRMSVADAEQAIEKLESVAKAREEN